MSNYLLVPTRLDALYTPHGRVGVEAMADFSQLPYVLGLNPEADPQQKQFRDVNSDTAHISENIVAEPFSDASFWLKPGIHLHWALPDALTVGHSVSGQDALDFPAVPNRWLVKRTGGGVCEKSWFVESDYLWNPCDPRPDAVAYPLQKPPPGRPAFRYLGRTREIPYPEKKECGSFLHQHDEKLTALGYGEPTFHAFYPNCHSVFGLHDDQFKGRSLPQDLTYKVFGWYSNPADDDQKRASDPFAKFVADFNRTTNKDRPQGLESRDAFIRHLLNLPDSSETLSAEQYKTAFLTHLDAEYHWKIDNKAVPIVSNTIQLAGMVCFAEVSLSCVSGASNRDLTEVEVAVGNTGTEALSAYLASKMATGDSQPKRIIPEQKRQIEDQLEALNLTVDLAHHNIDLGPKFGEARHTSTFTAVPAGMLWTFRAPSETKTSDDASEANANALDEVELPAELANDLHDLNQLQMAYDRDRREIQSRRQQIFSDWYKYMICCYRPPEATREDDYPKSDYVKVLIENEVAQLDELQAKSASGLVAIAKKLISLINNDGRTNVQFGLPLNESSGLLSELVDNIKRLIDPAGNAEQQRLLGLNGALSELVDSTTWLIECPQSLVTKNSRHVDMLKSSLAPIGPVWETQLKRLLSATTKFSPRQSHPTDKRPVLLLAQTVAPRFWQPNEPVVLLAGPGVQSTDRHGEDGAQEDDGLVECVPIDVTDPTTDLAQSIVKSVEPRGKEFLPTAFRESDGQPWHPLMMEWRVEILQIKGAGNVEPETRTYNKDFVQTFFELRETQPDLTPVDKVVRQIGSTSVFTGRGIITPHAHQILSANIDDYLVSQTRAYLLATGQPLTTEAQPDPTACDRDYQSHLKYFNTYEVEITAWRDDEYRANLIDGYLTAPRTASDSNDAERKRQQLIDDAVPSSDPKFNDGGDYFNQMLAWYNERTNNRTSAQCPLHNVLKARKRLNDVTETQSDLTFGIQSQALVGFNASLLMHRQTLQLPIRDPLAFEEYQGFTDNTVSRAVADQNQVAPEPNFDFFPIRAGQMNFLALRIVDTFGQIADVISPDRKKPVITTERLSAIAGGLASWVGLPPRITQPARVNFRWLSAAVDDAVEGAKETNSHPRTSPICGWLLPNLLDGSLAIYDSVGAPLGSVDRSGTLHSPPGRNKPPGPYQLPPTTNAHMKSMVSWICHGPVAEGDNSFVQRFLDVLESSLENIDPENFAQHEAQALLMGRPMALVRAMVDLELQDPSATDQSWQSFRGRLPSATDQCWQCLQDKMPNTAGFRDVQFPFRIGEHQQLNDGVVGYWLEPEPEQKPVFYAPQNSKQVTLDGKISTGPAHSFDHSINDGPLQISLLIDPRGVVHCTSGVLPTKALSIPAAHYAKALAAIRITFLTAPVLTDPGRIELPLPDEPGWAWSWLDMYSGLENQPWRELTRQPLIDRQAFIDALPDGNEVWKQLKDKHLLQPAPQPAGACYVTRHLTPDDKFSVPVTTTAEEIKHTLEQLQYTLLGPPRQDAHTIQPQQIREGWLQLSHVSDSGPSAIAETADRH